MLSYSALIKQFYSFKRVLYRAKAVKLTVFAQHSFLPMAQYFVSALTDHVQVESLNPQLHKKKAQTQRGKML